MRVMSKLFVPVVVLSAMVLSGCETNPPKIAEPDVAKSEIPFVDFQGFDKDLHTSLAVPLKKVDVVFLDSISPNAMPERIQNWLAAVEAGGGKVEITPPKTDISAKDPFLVFSVVNAIWHASNFAKETAIQSEHEPAKKFNAEIVLKKGAADSSVVERVIFTRHE